MSLTTTTRPSSGIVSKVYGDESRGFAEGLLEAFDEWFDQGEGWIVRTDTGLDWFFGRLAMQLEIVESPGRGMASHFAEISIRLSEGATAVNPETLDFINSMNASSAGWVVVFDPDDGAVILKMRVPLSAPCWWSLQVMFDSLPLAMAVADSNADTAASLSGGSPATRVHPTRGSRPVEDGWVSGARMGMREPSASLEFPLTSYELESLRETLELHYPECKILISYPFLVEVVEQTGVVRTRLASAWHPQFGLGWQMASLVPSGNVGDLLTMGSDEAVHQAPRFNLELVDSTLNIPLAGGWISVPDFGLVRQQFLTNSTVESLAGMSRTTGGAVAGHLLAQFDDGYDRSEYSNIGGADITDLNERFDSAIRSLHFLTCRDYQADIRPADPGDSVTTTSWLFPRQVFVCSFGIFNPSGPTVSSIELGIDQHDWVVLHVIRHPFGAEIFERGRCPLGSPNDVLYQLVTDALGDEDDSPFGTGCDWLDIRIGVFSDAILAGLEKFIDVTSDVATSDSCRVILGSGHDPWSRLEMNPVDRLGDEDDLDECDHEALKALWMELVTDPNEVMGHQMFMRSGWEGALEYHRSRGNPESATWVSRQIIHLNRERLECDFDFRARTGRYIQSPRSDPMPDA